MADNNFKDIASVQDIYQVDGKDGKAAVIDAIHDIIAARQTKGKSRRGKRPDEINVDPRLNQPTPGEVEPDDDDDHTEVEIDDPENLLKNNGGNSKDKNYGLRQDGDGEEGDDAEDADKHDSIDDEINSKIGKNEKKKDSPNSASHDKPMDGSKKQRNDLVRARDFAEKVINLAKKKQQEKGIKDEDIQRIVDDKNELDKLIDKIKNGENVSPEESDDLIRQTLDDIGKISQVDIDKNTKTRVQKIQTDIKSPRTRVELGQEDSENKVLDKSFGRGVETSYKQRKSSDFEEYADVRPIEQFTIDFYNSIRDQIQRVEAEVDSYTVLNPQAEDEDSIRPGTDSYETSYYDKPHVCMYVDRSTSWDSSDVSRANRAISSILEFKEQGKIELTVKYFSDSVVTENPYASFPGGTVSWNYIMSDIEKNGYNNIVLVTDSDMNGQAANSEATWVSGEVWFIWKTQANHARCTDIIRKLRGERNPNTSQEYCLYNR